MAVFKQYNVFSVVIERSRLGGPELDSFLVIGMKYVRDGVRNPGVWIGTDLMIPGDVVFLDLR